ncbi:FAD-binding domain protein [Mycena chlorophos]|uniref:FAD-binding domain protein n=1 Tax=Mycena chlorophos TaxID=658473 RepID=A0A8H6TNR5_MYCCL|nr:FAD-binding domain protein [Mycena chlorophos]
MDLEQRLRILVVGGGLAGLAAAAYLRGRHEVTVLERFTLVDFARNDYAMSITANTHRFLRELGAEDWQLQAVPLKYVWGCDAKGNVNETVAQSITPSGATTIFARRSRIHKELLTAATSPRRAGTPAKIVENVKITSVDVEDGVIRTEDGRAFRGDLIIGADGVNSIVRAAILGTVAPSASPSGVAAYLCTVPRSALDSDPSLSFQTNADAGLATFRGSDADGRPKSRVLFYPADPNTFQIVAYHDESPWVERFEKSGSSIVPRVSQLSMLQTFDDFTDSVKRVLAQATSPDVWRIRDIDRMESWAKGKAVIVGDAAHAILPYFGLGCNLAIEDGEALGYFLSNVTSASELPQALARFAALRVARAHMVQLAGRQAAGLVSEEEKESLPPFDGKAFMAKVYAYFSAEQASKEMCG